MTASGHAASPAQDLVWRALAILLVLLGLPSASFRDAALADDWYFGALDHRAAVLLEARKSVVRISETDPGQGGEAASGEDDKPDAVTLRAPAAAVTAAAAARISPLAALTDAQRVSLLPDCTGPPRT